MNLEGYTQSQLEAMQEVAARWIHTNVPEVDRCISTVRSVHNQMDEFNKSTTARRVSSKIINDLTAQRIDPTFSHTIKDMVYEVVSVAAKIGSTYEEFRKAVKDEVARQVSQRK